MKIIGLDHIVLRCRDLERMNRFYCDVLGCSVDKRVDWLGMIHLRAGTQLIDLVSVDGQIGKTGGAPPAADGHNMDHLCLRIEPFDIQRLREHFEAFGIDLGNVQNNYGAAGNGPSVYLKDPENNTIELKGYSHSG